MCECDFAKRTVLQCASVRVRSGKAIKTYERRSHRFQNETYKRCTERETAKAKNCNNVRDMRINTMSHMKIIILLFSLCSSPSLGHFRRLCFAPFHFIRAGGEQIEAAPKIKVAKIILTRRRRQFSACSLLSPRCDVRMTSGK